MAAIASIPTVRATAAPKVAVRRTSVRAAASGLRTQFGSSTKAFAPLGYVSRRPNNHGEARESRERRAAETSCLAPRRRRNERRREAQHGQEVMHGVQRRGVRRRRVTAESLNAVKGANLRSWRVMRSVAWLRAALVVNNQDYGL